MRNFREYDFWKDSMTLAKDIFIVTKDFPRYDGISNQIQRAVVSIPSNIAEGSSRASETDFARFLEISLGSAYETETQLEILYSINYISENTYVKLISNIQSIEKRLSSLINKIRKQKSSPEKSSPSLMVIVQKNKYE